MSGKAPGKKKEALLSGSCLKDLQFGVEASGSNWEMDRLVGGNTASEQFLEYLKYSRAREIAH